MSDIVELPDEQAILAVSDFLREGLPGVIARINSQRADEYQLQMPEIIPGYQEPMLSLKFPYISIWTPVDEMRQHTRVELRGDLEVRCLICLVDHPRYSKRLMYRYTAALLYLVKNDYRLGNRVSRATYVRSRYYTPTWNQETSLELYVGESYLNVEQEVYRS